VNVTKDKPMLSKPRNLNQIVENPARASFASWLAALKRAKKLKERGYDVTLPPPRIGRPQFFVISKPKPTA
jgi:hypothetical protein